VLPSIPNDPLFPLAWHLLNTGQKGGTPGMDINVTPVWPHYTGNGVTVAVLDSGVDTAHPDLAGNVRSDLGGFLNGLPVSNVEDEHHGTAVAGLIAARGDNGIGSIGVAPEAGLVSFRMLGVGAGGATEAAFLQALRDGVHVTNNSWGPTVDRRGFFPADDDELEAMRTFARDGRGGLGGIVVFANGNERTLTFGDSGITSSSDTTEFSADRHVISVAAVDRNGLVASYSSAGANLLVSAPGGFWKGAGETIKTTDGVVSTDRSGAEGYNRGDYTPFDGTSAATPIVSGVVALMLEANARLGLRDVQEILAVTARQVHADAPGWVATAWGNANGGGLAFSRDYGFGLVDAAAAVRLAESWTAVRTAANWAEATAVATSGGTPVPGLAFMTSFLLPPGTAHAGGLRINRVELDLKLEIAGAANVEVTLTSPSGTTVTLARFGTFEWAPDAWTFTSPAWWGEDSAGSWTLSLSIEAADGFVFEAATLRVLGDAPSGPDLRAMMLLTDGFTRLAAAEPGRALLGTGEETALNASATSAAMVLDLRGALGAGGGESRVAGVLLGFAKGNQLKDAMGGGGDDRIIGHRGENSLSGGWGHDTVLGGGGGDTVSGGAGNDRLLGDDGDDGLDGGDGDDRLIGGAGDDALLGGSGRDALFGGAGDDFLQGGVGADSLDGASGNDDLRGGVDADRLSGGTGHDTLRGDSGNDLLLGGGGDDSLLGGAGADTLTGDAGADTLLGGEGDDRLAGKTGVDQLFGGDGNDTLFGEDGTDGLSGGAGRDLLRGGASDDLLFGEAGADTLFGDAGADFLDGQDDDDLLHGGDGSDTLFGGAGADTLRGGADADIFTWIDAADSTVGHADLVLDLGLGDLLNITGAVGFDFAFIGMAEFGGVAREVRTTTVADGLLLLADLDGDGGGDFALRLAGIRELSQQQFLIA
jgi:Ca2+-binding RTX toxin-like protein